MGRFDALYARLPLPAQHAAVSAYGVYWYWLRFGPGYRRYVNEYAARDLWSAGEWSAWQERRIRGVLASALEVPYYRETWTAAERRAAQAGRLSDLPLLGKEPIRANPQAFVWPRIAPRRPLVFHTSGSTGTPIASYWSAAEVRRSLAVREVRSAGWAGVSFRQARATFSGRMVEPDADSAGPFYRYNAVERQTYLSPFHLRPATARQYVAALRRGGVVWLTGYAVSYYLLARLIQEQGLVVPPLRAVITTSEGVTPAMRVVMEAAYGCRVYEEYSTVENVLFASECGHGRLHVSPDIGLIEILRPDGTPCRAGEAGEVVVTSLMRRVQPLIRYRLGDVALWDAAPCPCGRAMPVLQAVVGRLEDVVVGPDGRQLVRFHGVFIDQPHIREGQVIQEALDRIRVKVVPVADFGPADVADIVARVQRRLGPTVTVVVEPVAAIPRTAAGKFQAVISLLPPTPSSPAGGEA